MPEDRQLVEPRNVTLYPTHWATVDAYAKDGGYGSTSAGLRRIIDEWLQYKKDAAANTGRAQILEDRYLELWAAASNALSAANEDGYDARQRLQAAVTRGLEHLQPSLLSQAPAASRSHKAS